MCLNLLTINALEVAEIIAIFVTWDILLPALLGPSMSDHY